MALTGMDIFKMLPKTNCRECGVPTCLAFAMSLASGKIELSACPYVSDEAKAKMAEADAPPVKVVTIGNGSNSFKTGGESVMFRHEKNFNNPTGIALLISDTMDDTEVDARLQKFDNLRYCRLGIVLRAELVAVKNESRDVEKFVHLIEKVMQIRYAKLILMSDSPEIMSAGLDRCAEEKPLIYAATSENLEQMAELGVKHSCPVAVKASGLEELTELSTRLMDAGVEDIVLDSGARTLRQALEDQVQIRRAAVYQKISALCFPTIGFACEMADTLSMETLVAAMLIAKYAGIAVLSDFRGDTLFPLLLERMELFGDPQEPYMAPEGVHEIGKPDRNAPVLLVSSWALSYYTLSLAAEVARTPVFLCIEKITEPDVMCWCSHCFRSTQRGKFNAESTARFVRQCKMEERVDHRKLMISMRNADLKGELEKALPEWEIVVGPAEATLLNGFQSSFAQESASA